jgi:hypothetical protein
MSDLRDRLATVIVKHHTCECDRTVDGTWTQCQCDAGWRREDEWAAHVADAVIAELGLEEELTYGGMMRRYVTDWKADDE